MRIALSGLLPSMVLLAGTAVAQNSTPGGEAVSDAQFVVAIADIVHQNCTGLHVEGFMVDKALKAGGITEDDARSSDLYKKLVNEQWQADVRKSGLQTACWHLQVQFAPTSMQQWSGLIRKGGVL